MLHLKNILKIALLFVLLNLGLNANANTGKATLNFNNADIRAVIEAVSKATGKNFIVDPRVSGKVTMISSSEMDGEAIYNTFLSILSVHSFIAIELNDDLIKIIPANQTRTESGIKQLSKVSRDDVLVRIIHIEHVEATKLIPILRPLISRNGHLVAHRGSNNILVSDTKNNIDKLHAIIQKIDKANKTIFKVIKVKHADAYKLLSLVKSAISKGSGGSSKARFNKNLAADKRSNSILIRGSETIVKEVKRIVSIFDKPTEKLSSRVKVIKLSHSTAVDVAKVIQTILRRQSRGSSTGGKKGTTAQVSVDKKVNAVVVMGTTQEIKEVELMVEELDIKRSQVMVEALIVEMNADKSAQLGIQWSVAAGVDGSSALRSGSIGSIIGRIRAGGLVSFDVLAEALATDKNANLISAPSIMTLENEEAEIEVGREVPFITGSYTSGNDSAVSNPFQTITRKSVGLKLKITPQINRGNVVKLKIEQEISSLLPGDKISAGASDVITSKRLIKTSILVNDGHMIVLGGLIGENVRESESGTPLLSKLPLLGGLFRHRGTDKEKSNLMIFIRPVIIDSPEKQRLLTSRRYNYMRKLQAERYVKGVNSMPRESQPLLKNIYPDDYASRSKTTIRKNSWFGQLTGASQRLPAVNTDSKRKVRSVRKLQRLAVEQDRSAAAKRARPYVRSYRKKRVKKRRPNMFDPFEN